MTDNNLENSVIPSNHHNSVMFEESISGLNIKPDGIYIDATFGRGGHSQGVSQTDHERAFSDQTRASPESNLGVQWLCPCHQRCLHGFRLLPVAALPSLKDSRVAQGDSGGVRPCQAT